MENKNYNNENTIKLKFLGRDWFIIRANMEELWEEMVELSEKNNINESGEIEERIPYFAELWASSLALGSWLGMNRESIKGKFCLDLGCGLGFTAMVGAYLGAKVLGVDFEPRAIALALENAEKNNFNLVNYPQIIKNNYNQNGIDYYIDFQVMDWRRPWIAKNSLDIIWASDIIYEKKFFEPVTKFLNYALKIDGYAYIAEPNRTIFTAFPDLIKKMFLVEKVYFEKTKALSENIPSANVSIWKITKK